ncbi:MAG: hypothetical protein PVG07_02810 [Acidobacteriota bacterium]|jgi:hypothetical protein
MEPRRRTVRPSVRPALPLLAALLVLVTGLGACSSEPFYLGGIQVNEPDLGHWVESLDAAGMNTVSVTDYAKQGDWDSANLWWDDDRSGELAEIRAAEAGGLQTVLILRVALDHAFERNRFLWHGMIQPRTEEQLAEWFDRYGRFAEEWARVAEEEGVDLLMIASEMNSLTSTVRVDAVPQLEAYFLNEEQQATRRADSLAGAEDVDAGHLWTRSGATYDSLAAYLDDRIGTERAWADRVTGGGREPADRVAFVNARRALLERHWTELVERVRAVYDGPLGYAANFDQYRDVSFWDRLDVIGINAYFPLRTGALDEPDPAVLRRELVAGWQDVLGRIDAFRRERGIADRPVVFTELGYTRRAGTTVQPWAGEGLALLGEGSDEARLVAWQDRPLRPEERALALEALQEANSSREKPFLRGLLYWKLSTIPEHREIEPFVAILGEEPPDPAVAALRSFR